MNRRRRDAATAERKCEKGPRRPGRLISRLIGMGVAEGKQLAGETRDACSSQRRHREAVERELFHGRHKLVSKNDDDVPVPWMGFSPPRHFSGERLEFDAARGAMAQKGPVLRARITLRGVFWAMLSVAFAALALVMAH